MAERQRGDAAAALRADGAVAAARALHSTISTYRKELPYLQKCAEATLVLKSAIETSNETGAQAAVLATLKEAVAVGEAVERETVQTIDWRDFDALVSNPRCEISAQIAPA